MFFFIIWIEDGDTNIQDGGQKLEVHFITGIEVDFKEISTVTPAIPTIYPIQ
jgi:hypothetical protein